MEQISDHIAAWRKMNLSDQEIVALLLEKGLSAEDAQKALTGEFHEVSTTSPQRITFWNDPLAKFSLVCMSLVALTLIGFNNTEFGGAIIAFLVVGLFVCGAIFASVVIVVNRFVSHLRNKTSESAAHLRRSFYYLGLWIFLLLCDRYLLLIKLGY